MRSSDQPLLPLLKTRYCPSVTQGDSRNRHAKVLAFNSQCIRLRDLQSNGIIAAPAWVVPNCDEVVVVVGDGWRVAPVAGGSGEGGTPAGPNCFRRYCARRDSFVVDLNFCKDKLGDADLGRESVRNNSYAPTVHDTSSFSHY